jgi:hypothetical protein
METYQARIHRENVERENSYIQELEHSRGSVSVGYGEGIVGVTLRDKSLRMLQTNLNKAQIDKLMAELAEARQHLEFCEEAERFLCS